MKYTHLNAPVWSLDFESYGEAGFIWNESIRKWKPITSLYTTTKGGKGGLPAVGAAAYAAHPHTEVLCLSYGISDQWVETWIDGMPNPEPLLKHVTDGGILSGQNVMFEYWLWFWQLHKKLGWPALDISRLIDTAALCRAYGVPGKLDLAGKMLLPEHLRKLNTGKSLITKFCVPKPPIKKDPERRRIYMENEPRDAADFIIYNQYDIISEGALLRKCPPLPPVESRMWEIDAQINDRGVHVDLPGLQRCIEYTNYHTLVGNAEIQKLTGGAVQAASELKKMGTWLESRGLIIGRTPKNDYALAEEDTDRLLLKPLPPDIKRVVELRQNLAGAAIKKLFAMARMMGPGNRLRGMFEYWAAHTGRWAGRGVQLQNNPPSLKPPQGTDYDAFIDHTLMHTDLSMTDIKGCLRGLLTASPGNELVSSDYNSIEAVVAAVLADEPWRLEVFSTHGKIYETSASKITGTPFSEFMDHKKRTGEHHPERNAIGKYAELASGFGGWVNAWKKFGADKHLTDAEIKKAVLAWRAASPNIVEMWGGQWRKNENSYGFRPELYGLEGAWVRAMHSPEIPVQVGKFITITYHAQEDVIRMGLPSGRPIVYQQPRLAPGKNKFHQSPQFALSFLGYQKGQIVRIGTYGGKLFENAVQATARDRLRDAMILLEDNHYPIVIHVHDEPTSDVPIGFGSVEEYEKILQTPAPWCHNWPIRASGGWRGKRYRK